jgi:hypothetical protein
MNAGLQIIQFWKVNLNSYKEKQRKKGKLSTMLCNEEQKLQDYS